MQWGLIVLVLMGQCSFFMCHLHEYHFVEEEKNWTEAQQYCREHHTDLATVSNMTDMERLRDSAQNHSGAWIGLSNHTGANRMWHWSLPGVEYNESESNWDDNEPNDKIKPENCVQMEDEKWADTPCTEERKSVCYDERKQSNKKFHVIEDKMSWPQAQSYCREHHTDLVSGDQQLEDDEFKREYKSNKYVWIGLFRDSWRWSDGSNHSFRYWDLELFRDEDSSKKCAVTLPDGKWSSDECNQTKPFFCYDGQCSHFMCHYYEYHFVEEEKTWTEAQQYCKKNYTDLATVSNMTDMERLRDSAQNHSGAWIGLYNHTDANRMWHWSLPGVEYKKSEKSWDKNEPNDKIKPENCVQMEDEKWADAPCTTKHEFVCYDERKQSNKRFHLIEDRMSWPQAQSYCREHHTDLVSGDQQLEDDEFKREYESHRQVWIGLFRDSWRWSDGSNHSFRYWHLELFRDEDSSKKCAVTLPDGKWSSDECNKTKPFFCYDGQCSHFMCHYYEYHFVEEEKTWIEAQQYCKKNYTDLATVSNMTDMERLCDSAQNQDGAWIGLYNHTDTNRMWHWSLPRVEYEESESNWDDNEPNDKIKPENCVQMEDEKWADAPCTTKHEFVCCDERKQSNKRFHLIENKMSWPQAQNYCREHHTDLVSGDQQLEDDEFKTEYESDKEVWIGLFRDSWRWSDGSNHSFRYWDLELFRDVDSSKKCAVTLLDGKWSSDECNKTKPFFCYDDKVILIKENLTWEDALNYCREKHCDLVSITNPHQQRWVQERAKKADTTHVWLGLRYTCVMDLWFWVNDNAVCYQRWASEEKTESCDRAAAMSREGEHEWYKKADNETFNFICTVK